MGQNAIFVPGNKDFPFYIGSDQGKYPFGWDYLYFGFYRYINYLNDPLTVNPFCKGIPFQIAASGKDAVTILPLSSVGKEVGAFMNAEAVAEVLQEIQAYMFRRGTPPIYSPPELGRVALAGFSASTGLVATFLSKSENQKHDFYKKTLKEVYFFDPPKSVVGSCVSNAMAWAKAGESSDKMIRLYTQWSSESLKTLLDGNMPKATPFIESSNGGLWSGGLLPISAWMKASSVAQKTKPDDLWQVAHQLISAMMLTEALRRSGF